MNSTPLIYTRVNLIELGRGQCTTPIPFFLDTGLRRYDTSGAGMAVTEQGWSCNTVFKQIDNNLYKPAI